MNVNEMFGVRRGKHDDPWSSVSDLMSGLMIIFMFVAIAYMTSVQQGKKKIENIVILWDKTQEAIYRDLYNEFKDDLPKWRASLNKETLSIRFEEPSVYFETGSDILKDEFKKILKEFFPRYLNRLRKHRENIAEVRIEGHTSSEWVDAKNELDAYFRNMELSQSRTRSVLQYCLTLPAVSYDIPWMRDTITANGLSSSKPILTSDGREDKSQSRRVEFRVRTDAEKRIVTILEEIR
ncbi:MAG: OmpA family protein [Synergistaceae bacterium]|jgi:outer membrane protein OmpA-like peptidoglycan-associated protein|nr:OmpA family protein [Synergistaceae bacterium]